MAYRRKMRRKANKRSYRSGARVKKKNSRARPMRGGWRL